MNSLLYQLIIKYGMVNKPFEFRLFARLSKFGRPALKFYLFKQINF